MLRYFPSNRSIGNIRNMVHRLRSNFQRKPRNIYLQYRNTSLWTYRKHIKEALNKTKQKIIK